MPRDHIRPVQNQAGKVVSVSPESVVIRHLEPAERKHDFNARESLLVENGQSIGIGQPMTNGHHNLRRLMDLTDVYSVQKYLMMEVQGIYASQGQTINDKHIEIIVKQMFSRVRVIDPGEIPISLLVNKSTTKKL